MTELKTVLHKYLRFPYRKMSDESNPETTTAELDNYNQSAIAQSAIALEHRMSLRDLMFLENASLIDAAQFIPPVKYGKVVKVYDGDTITIVATLDFGLYHSPQLYKFSVRLNGIDTPELKTKNENEKKLAMVARDELKKQLDNKIVELKNVSLEKYGRLLADVYVGDVCVNEWMVTNGYAVRYDGGTKERPEDWER